MNLGTRSLLLICSATACWAFSFGVGSQVVSHWLTAQGQSDTVIGLSHSFYYLGLAVAACAVPKMTRGLGPVGCASLGMILAGITVIFFPWGGSEWSWYLLRFLNGCAGAMSLVPLEIVVSRDSAAERKTQNFAYYGVSLTVGVALGICGGLSLYQPGDNLAFYLGGCVPIGAGTLLFVMLKLPPAGVQQVGRAPLFWGRNLLSYGTAWCQGFLEGGLVAFLTLFLLSRGISESIAGTLMGVTMIGVILFQIPVSWLADRLGKTPILLGCYAVVAIGLLTIPLLSNAIGLAIVLFCFGACTGAMYPLGLSLLSDRMSETGLARAYAWYLAIECVGSLIGAAAMGRARDDWGEAAMFHVGLAAVIAVLATCLAWNFFTRNPRRFSSQAPAATYQRHPVKI